MRLDLHLDIGRDAQLLAKWTPGIDRLSVGGWFIVLGYVLAAWACVRACRAAFPGTPETSRGYGSATGATLRSWGRSLLGKEPMTQNTRAALLWLLIGMCALSLVLNRVLDLEGLVTITFRNRAVTEGWYRGRRPLQIACILCFALMAILALGLALRLGRGQSRFREIRLALMAMMLLLCLVATRAISYHKVDRLMALGWGPVHVNGLLEMGGIGLVVLGAVWFSRNAVAVGRAEHGH